MALPPKITPHMFHSISNLIEIRTVCSIKFKANFNRQQFSHQISWFSYILVLFSDKLYLISIFDINI